MGEIFLDAMLKGKSYATKSIFRFTLAASCHICKAEVMLKKMSCVHGIVRPPIG